MKLPKDALKKLERLLETNPNVVGYSATTKYKLIGKTPRRAVRVYVARKIPKSRITPRTRIPGKIAGFPVDVFVLGKLELTPGAKAITAIKNGAQGHIERFRPLEGGVSACNAMETYGTLGYFLRDNTDPPPPRKPQWYILSCAHVLEVKGSPQETMQPSPNDHGQYPGDLVGILTLSGLPTVDAAIAQIDVGAVAAIEGVPSPKSITKVTEEMVRDTGFLRHHAGILVQKSGRTTGVTEGWIIDGNYRTKPVTYAAGVTRQFSNCLLIESVDVEDDFQLPGDSGSLLVEAESATALGLVFGMFNKRGAGTLGIACRIEDALDAFPNKIMVKPGESWP